MEPSLLQVVRDIAAIAAAVVGVFVALRGLQTWRRQIRANTELEVARLVLRAVLKLRDAVELLRQPFVPIEEIASATRAVREREPDRESEFLKNWERPVYAERSQTFVEALSQYRAATVEAEILWGQPFRTELGDLETQLRELRTALQEFVRYSDLDHRGASQEALREQYRKVLQSRGQEDPFNAKFNVAVTRIENHLRPRIRLGHV